MIKYISFKFIFKRINFKILFCLIEQIFIKLQENMYNSWFQQIRFPLESIQNLEKAIVSEMLALKDNPKDKSMAENRIYNFLEMIQQKSKDVINFSKQQTAMKKQQLSIIQGHKSLKASEKKKPADVIWQNFYDKSRQIKEYYKKNQNNLRQEISQNDIQFFRRVAFLPPFKQPQFSIEQNKGKYVDMHHIYNLYTNLWIGVDKKQNVKVNDYLWFLQNMDKFDDFPLNRKVKYYGKYLTYLKELSGYLESYIKRSRPLFKIQAFIENVKKTFDTKFAQGNVHGWEPEHEKLDETQWQYCNYCQHLYTNDQVYIGHLSGENHIKKLKKKQNVDMDSPEYVKLMAQKQQAAKKKFKQTNMKKKYDLAFQQFKIIKLREQLANVIYDTMNLVRKKQTRGYEQVNQFIDQSSQSQDADAPIYNPKNLPLGWDGKPIPYWLYKLHGLSIEYKCQICGNFSYWGRRAFEMHFQQWRHTYGMKCLGIPNTIHFKDVTTISDALALHEKLVRQSQQSQFRPDLDEQFEDNQGNILNRRTYTDMKKQGLIQN